MFNQKTKIMKNQIINFEIDLEDLKVLFLHTKFAFKKNITFNMWVHNCQSSYEQYFERQIQLNETPKSFSQWVNGQIIALT